MVLDALDRRLLASLLEDGRRSHRELARRTGSTGPTVASRIRRMEELGVIQGYTVRLDPARFGSESGSHVDLAAAVHVDCHTCGRPTSTPLWLVVGGRRHPFCCATCKGSYQDRYARAAEGL